MKRSRFTEDQINGILKEHAAGISVADLFRKHGQTMLVRLVAASTGTKIRKPLGIDVFTAMTATSDPKSSMATVEIQKLAMVSKASAPAIRWMVIFILGTPGLLQVWLRDTVVYVLK